MPRRTGLIFACDFSDRKTGVAKMREVAPYVDVFKIGLEAMTAESSVGITLATYFREEAGSLKKSVFWDMKLHDIGNTVVNAAHNIAKLGSKFFTLHAQASNAALSGAAETTIGTICVPLAVTVLTDLDDEQCQFRFRQDSPHAVIDFARNAYGCGIRGFVCSAKEARLIRRVTPPVTIVTPAIRPLWAAKPDEQKRIVTPSKASEAGADYVVVGRPIAQPPEGMTSAEAAQKIREELDNAPVAA